MHGDLKNELPLRSGMNACMHVVYTLDKLWEESCRTAELLIQILSVMSIFFLSKLIRC